MPWISNEDSAIKAKLSGIVVHVSGTRTVPVPVRFVTPEFEVADMTYPIILIERVGINPAPEREHRGRGVYPYPLEGLPSPDADDLWVNYGDFPLPMNVDYQVSTMCRSNTQQSELNAILSKGDRIPPRFGYVKLPVFEQLVPLTLLAGPEPLGTVDADGKRLFSMHYLVRIETEMLPYDPQRYEIVQSVHGRITDEKTRKWTLSPFADGLPETPQGD